MSDTQQNHIFDGTRENFQQMVLGNSYKGVVLANYWTPKAGPCFKLWQDLEALSKEYQGRFLLININTETQKALSRQNGITSVPTVKLYVNGEIVDTIYGAESKRSIKSTIDKYVQSAKHPEITRALQTYQSGSTEDALKILVNHCIKNPHEIAAHSIFIKLLLREKRYSDISAYMLHLPDNVKAHEEINSLWIHARIMEFAESTTEGTSADTNDNDTSVDLKGIIILASIAITHDDYETALDNLIKALQIDRSYEQGFARKAMLEIFRLLGDEHELTQIYQKRLRDLMH